MTSVASLTAREVRMRKECESSRNDEQHDNRETLELVAVKHRSQIFNGKMTG
jgi:hypothetical protein